MSLKQTLLALMNHSYGKHGKPRSPLDALVSVWHGPLSGARDLPTRVIADDLLDRGADPNTLDADSEPVFNSACVCMDVPTVKAMINHGANVNLRGADGNTPLMWAVLGFRADVVNTLLVSGADANQCNFDGYNAYQYASWFFKDINPPAGSNAGKSANSIVWQLKSALATRKPAGSEIRHYARINQRNRLSNNSATITGVLTPVQWFR